ncbi:MAG TPA: flagellin [Terriglobales bacterium]|nr:flagellin [Terriglobales bacterium]
MALSILTNIPSLAAQNQLSVTNSNLQKTLFRLSSGSRINTGADDAAGLAIADGLHANVTALTQSARNATDGVGMLQVADGALGQITSLLNRAVTLATEAANGTVSADQITALNQEYLQIQDEIGKIGTNTTYNGQVVFAAANATLKIFMSDGSSSGDTSLTVGTALGQVDATHLGTVNSATAALTAAGFTDAATAQTELGSINTAIAGVAGLRGQIGAYVNQLQAATNVMNNQVQNLSAAEDGIRAADIPAEVANLTKYNILSQTGISALAQANQMQQSVLSLLK